jgi:cell division protein FtsI/penicillin-binding protein 2
MAMVTAAIANGGYVYRPRLIRDPKKGNLGELINAMNWSPDTLTVIQGGMYDVIQAPRGTGTRAAIRGIEMAGKTGSAEYGPKANRKKHGWMILFAPFRNPRYAVAMVIEDAVSGGVTTAPRMRDLMQAILNLPSTTSPATASIRLD